LWEADLTAGVLWLSASVGVAANKFLAKVASDVNKPAGITVVAPGHAESFLRFLPVIRIPGIGPVTEKEIHRQGIKTVGELARLNRTELCKLFGSWGEGIGESVYAGVLRAGKFRHGNVI